jgi:rod shape-determining protein MreD
MKNLFFWLLSIALIMLQIGFVSALRPFGIVPNLILVIVIITGLQSTLSQSLTIAVIGGLALDITSGSDFGLRTVLFVLAALATGFIRRSGITLGGPSMALLIVAIGTILIDVTILISVASNVSHWPVARIFSIMGLELLLNSLLVILVLPIYRRLTSEKPEIMVAL